MLPLRVEVDPGDETAGQGMDCASFCIASRQGPGSIDSGIEPKRRRLEDDSEQNSDKLAQLKRDIEILKAACEQGNTEIATLLSISTEEAAAVALSGGKAFSEECRAMMSELISENRAMVMTTEFEEDPLLRLDDGSLLLKLNGTSASFLKVETWELEKCGCDFCGIYSSSRDDLQAPV